MEKAKPVHQEQNVQQEGSGGSAFQLPPHALSPDITKAYPPAVPGKLLHQGQTVPDQSFSPFAAETASPEEPPEARIQMQPKFDPHSPEGIIHTVFSDPLWQKPAVDETKPLIVTRPDQEKRAYRYQIIQYDNGTALEVYGKKDPQQPHIPAGQGSLIVDYIKEHESLFIEVRTQSGDAQTGYSRLDTDIAASETIIQFVNQLSTPPKKWNDSWTSQEGYESINYTAYQKNLGKLTAGNPDDATPAQKQEAAWDTWTGKLARRLGFTQISTLFTGDNEEIAVTFER